MPDDDTQPDEGFELVCSVDDVPDLMPRRVEVNGRGVLICKTDEGFSAVDEICPHKDRSMQYGVVQRGQIICPHHRYKFDLQTGRCGRRRKCPPVAVYDVKVVDGDVYVRPS